MEAEKLGGGEAGKRWKVGGWKEFFTEEHKRLFKEVAGDLLVKLAYEENNSW